MSKIFSKGVFTSIYAGMTQGLGSVLTALLIFFTIVSKFSDQLL
jgi:hypothetical protein